MKDNEIIKVNDSKDFHYEVEVQHRPHFGFSTAFYKGSIIGQCELGRILHPISDDDNEWEMYEQRFSDWRDEVIFNLKITCQHYFDRL